MATKVRGVNRDRCRVRDERKCRCGKRPFYNEEAAVFALDTARASLVEKRRETRTYECEATPGTWHLSSLTLEQLGRRRRLWAITTIAQWGADVDYTIRVRPGIRLPNRNVIRIILKVSAARG